MKLIITGKDQEYKVEGSLIKMHIRDFKKEFNNVFEKENELTINLNGLTAIDNQGVAAIAQLHNEALSKNIKLTVIGFNNKGLPNRLGIHKIA
ncbi:STAS domain-containing protein [Oceanihabitans sediminis]|uniref:STAS domain-containing protein n=1 Tax=Oceanihabitans sediminis TaxID=1812012 RepID=A0A368P9Q3_9FLAO|nr:STAS domain-containing protein [Oceanihabitans sediminis]MDX1278422.1 STAS domain-containing protein [Oceanihabitans sediminis]MDX1773979.1 STAS domain-containing protein [Oceanihabitans sediminis]RBP31994.1 STAS domain-containing protein [Oceanihabitans sediminis]RCU58655.1 STAS domain-containing protein [Oceanihabitans sediminis]